jgi:hypothetical protein
MAKLFSNQRLKAVGRLLNDEEMEQVFGGYGIADEGLDQFLGAYGQPADDDDDDDDEIVVIGDPGGEHDDEDEDYGDDDDDSEDGSGDIVVVGERPSFEISSTCPNMTMAADQSLDFLYANSATARALIDTMAANGVTLSLADFNNSGFGARAEFSGANNLVAWDPFQVATGVNSNGTVYVLAPIMILAHELVHAGHPNDPAYQGAASEPLVMSIANRIAAELNAATGRNYEDDRDNHERTGLYDTDSPFSSTYSIAPPNCG